MLVRNSMPLEILSHNGSINSSVGRLILTLLAVLFLIPEASIFFDLDRLEIKFPYLT